MATLLHLASQGKLVKLDPMLQQRVQEERVIYMSLALLDWMDKSLPKLLSQWNIEISPQEQLAAFVEIFASGKVLNYRHQFWPLNNLGSGVWELKTADLRVFGWFPSPDCFIAHRADSTERIKRHKLYAGYVGEVVRFRDQLELDGPKFIEGEDPRVVVSNFSFPN